jgi:hypothetical protein
LRKGEITIWMSLFVISVATGLGGGTLGSAAASHSAGSALAVGRLDGHVDVLLGLGSDQERRGVDHLLADADVSLADQHTGVVNGLGKTSLEDLGLESSLHESLGRKLQDVIKGILLVSHETVSLQSADQRGGLEKTLGRLLGKSHEGTGSLAHLREHVLHSPDLLLAAKTVLTAELKLLVETLLLVRTTHGTVRLTVISMTGNSRHGFLIK